MKCATDQTAGSYFMIRTNLANFTSKMLPLVLTAACATSFNMRRIGRLPFGEWLLWFFSAETCCPGITPTQEHRSAGVGNEAA